jgi:hypothetical protein
MEFSGNQPVRRFLTREKSSSSLFTAMTFSSDGGGCGDGGGDGGSTAASCDTHV